MPQLLAKLQKLMPDTRFEAGDSFFWSPKGNTVTYNRKKIDTPDGRMALLHESSHALLAHQRYHSDFELVMMEVAAWERAKLLAEEMGVAMDNDHVQDCLDTYRDWLHQRSTCPRCGVICLQFNAREYHCHNCNNIWQVSQSRFCRPYRMQKYATA